MKDDLYSLLELYPLTTCTMTKKIFTVAMLVAASLGTTSVAQAAFSDVPMGHWAEAAITWASDVGLMKGPDNMPGMFDPAGLANRAQLAVIFQRFTTMMDAKLADINTKVDSLDKAKDMNVTESLLKSNMLDRGFMAWMNGKQEAPMVNSNGTGTGYFMLAADGLHYSVEIGGLTGGVTAAHIHSGKIGEDGPARHTMKFTNNMAQGVWRVEDMTNDDLNMLLRGEMYANVHTNSFTDGEIRGQVVPVMSTTFHGDMSPAQQTGDVDSKATGMVHAALFGNTLVAKVTYKDLSTAFKMAHIHSGRIGEDGPVVKDLSCDTAAMTCMGIWMNMSDADKMALWNGGLYANVHTEKYGSGEVRGQLLMR